MFYALEPNSKYEVVVQSRNKWGWSQTSNPFFFNTRATGKISQSSIESSKVSWVIRIPTNIVIYFVDT